MEDTGHYSTLIQNIFIILLLAYTLFIVLRLLKLSKNLFFTPVFKVHLAFVAVLCVTIFTSSFYVIIWWRPDEALYSPVTLYTLSIISGGMLQASFAGDIFLCLDRCFVIAFPKHYTDKLKPLLGLLNVFGLCGFLFYQIYSPLQLASKLFRTRTNLTDCSHIQCLLNNPNTEALFLIEKLKWGGINLALVIVLILLIKFKIKTSDIKNKLHYAVAVALIVTLIFEFVPNAVGLLINSIIGISTIFYAGPYWTTSSIINICICNYMYSRAILKKNFGKTIVGGRHPNKVFTVSHA